jgi:hypothetical protein
MNCHETRWHNAIMRTVQLQFLRLAPMRESAPAQAQAALSPQGLTCMCA